MANSAGYSGVNRYLQCLSTGLKYKNNYKLYWIHLLSSKELILHRIEYLKNMIKITIPLPEDADNIITYKYFMNIYCDVIWKIVSKHFTKEDFLILHLHTLNTITLALKIKEELINVKIINHVHCIPWKDKLNSNSSEFNTLYRKYYLNKIKHYKRREYLTSFSELDSYLKSDYLICVTQCAREFLIRIMGIDKHKISVISNGIEDATAQFRRNTSDKKMLRLLFVGTIIHSKGIEFILQAMILLKKKGIDVELRIVGGGMPYYIEMLRAKYKELRVNFLGLLDFNQLTHQYKQCDIGVMVSLQEQCSYAAIEMAMFGMPMVITSVDGLDEMFSDGNDCMKVSTIFDKDGLRVDIKELAEKIELLICSTDLRQKLSDGSRIKYLKCYGIKKMVRLVQNKYKLLIKINNDEKNEINSHVYR